MRTSVRRMVSVAALAALVGCGSLVPVGATEAEIDDPNFFRSGGSWEPPSTITQGDSGWWVARLQGRLAEAGFRPGAPDGRFAQATLGAVYAFQKVHDLDRDGVFREEHWDLLDTTPELPIPAEMPDRIEVDLTRQVLYLVKDHAVESVLPISSGNGATYRNARGTSVRARTPEGEYQFYKRVKGWRISYLGGLYQPYYFRGGYAIHGSSSVPPYPASHGCIRVEIHDMDYLTTELELGMPVFVYGQQISREDLLPPAPAPPPESRPHRYI